MKNQAAVELGKLGGVVRSERKAKTSAENGKKAACGQKFTLRSNFHTFGSINIRADVDTNLSNSQVKRIDRALCGMDDCVCGGINNCTVEDQSGNRYELCHSNNRDGSTSYWITTTY